MSSKSDDAVEEVEIEAASDGALMVEADEPAPVSGWKFAGRSILFRNDSA